MSLLNFSGIQEQAIAVKIEEDRADRMHLSSEASPIVFNVVSFASRD